MPVVLLLLLYYQSVSIFQRVLCSPVKVLYYLRPFLRPPVLLYAFQQLNIFLLLPGSLFETRIQVAVPVLSALLGISEYFVFSWVQNIDFLGNQFPVLAVLVLALMALLVDQLREYVALFLAPVVGSQVDFFETKPLEHAGLASDSRDEGSDGLPVCVILSNKYFTMSLSRSWYRLRSEYLDMTHMSIWTSYSLQFFFILLFLIILNN